MLKDAELKHAGIKTLIKQVGAMWVLVEKTTEEFNAIIQHIGMLAKILAESVLRPK